MNTLTMTINPASTSESIIQLAVGKSLAIVSGTITPTGLTNTTIYVDGEAGSTVTADYHRIAITFDDVACTDVQIGYDGSNYFDGFVGNVQIWNAAFDADDVEYDYLNCYQNLTADNRPSTSLTSDNLKGHWPLIAGSGDVAYDWSGNDNHGTLTNFPTDDSQWSNADALDSPLAIQTALCEWGMGSNLIVDATPHVHEHCTFPASTDIDGTELGFKLVEDTANSIHRGYYDYVTHSAGASTTWRVRLKENGRTQITFRGFNATDGYTTQIEVTISDGVSLGDGWYQHDITITPTTGTVTQSRLYFWPFNGGDVYQGDGSSGFYFCFPVVSEGTSFDDSATSYCTCTNALTPMRSWETAGQFKRDYSELNWNGRSYADCGNGSDVNPSTALIIECVVNARTLGMSRIVFGSIGMKPVLAVEISGVGSYFRGYIKVNGGANFVQKYGVRPVAGKIHLVFVYDSRIPTAYTFTNGALSVGSLHLDTGLSDYTICTDSYPLLIGGRSNGEWLLERDSLFSAKMYIDSEAQAIIDDDLAAWVAKRYAKSAAKYNL